MGKEKEAEKSHLITSQGGKAENKTPDHTAQEKEPPPNRPFSYILGTEFCICPVDLFGMLYMQLWMHKIAFGKTDRKMCITSTLHILLSLQIAPSYSRK